jgi:outer membrane protein assembly factor BamB
MYRRDTQRSGTATTAVPAKLQQCWEVPLTVPGTQPVIVGDRLWVAEKDAHRIRCLSATDGHDLWSYTAGGRIDSSPTVYGGLVLFGCADGSVVCLRASDGELVWRFRAAPGRERLVSYGQLESVWPVHGSVLVQEGVVYFAAGRSSFLDGGIAVYGLDARTGQVRYEHVLEGPWPDIHTDVGTPFAMEGALPDLFVSDGNDLYMQRIKFDAELNRLETRQESPLGELDMGANHLVATGGFLDDTGFDRVYWMHSHRWPGFYFAQQAPKSGQLVVFDDQTTYAVKYFYRRIQWSPALMPAEQGYLLFADDIQNQPALEEKDGTVKALDWLPAEAATDKHRRGGRGVEKGTGYVRELPPKWQTMIPLRVRAMLLAGDLLFVAGPPDSVDAADPAAAFEGRAGAHLQVFSAADGALIASHPLKSPPAFDGLAAAGERLYLATRDGRVICFAAE